MTMNGRVFGTTTRADSERQNALVPNTRTFSASTQPGKRRSEPRKPDGTGATYLVNHCKLIRDTPMVKLFNENDSQYINELRKAFGNNKTVEILNMNTSQKFHATRMLFANKGTAG